MELFGTLAVGVGMHVGARGYHPAYYADAIEPPRGFVTAPHVAAQPPAFQDPYTGRWIVSRPSGYYYVPGTRVQRHASRKYYTASTRPSYVLDRPLPFWTYQLRRHPAYD